MIFIDIDHFSRIFIDMYIRGSATLIHLRVSLYVLVIPPLREIWRVYMHDARGRIAPDGEGVYTSQITKKGWYR